MFTTKKKELFSVPTKTSSKTTATGSNAFVHEGLKKSSESLSGNGALKYSTTGNDFVDQFGSTGTFRAIRPYADIARDMNVLYTQNPELAVKFTLYLRTISRKVQLFDGDKTEKVQKGGGLKHESIMRMIWLNVNHRDTFWKNIKLFISVGSWKDIFVMLQTDLVFNGWEGRVLDWDNFGSLVLSGLENPNTVDLVKKYLPQIKSRSACTTVEAQANTTIGKFLVSKIFGVKSDNYATYKKYRQLKASGEAHEWQQLISKKLFDLIDFASVHGRALSGLVSSKFLANNKLEKTYEDWISAQPVAKYTGYVHELAMKIGLPNGGRGFYGTSNTTLKPYQKHTINKQYDGLVKLAKENVNVKSGLLVVRDTSGSMGAQISGQEISAYDVAKALGIFFGDLLEGHFANSWVEFNSTVKMHTYKEDNFVDKWLGDSSSYIGSTNFLAVADLFANIKRKGVSEAEFPTGIICISDGEFNRYSSGGQMTTTFEAFKRKLTEAGFSAEYVKNFQLILWDIRNNYYGSGKAQFETFGDAENVFYMSGFDGSILGFLLGETNEDGSVKATPKTSEELFQAAMDQEVLNLVTV